LRSQLLQHGGPSLVVMSVPWYLDPVEPEQLQSQESLAHRPEKD